MTRIPQQSTQVRAVWAALLFATALAGCEQVGGLSIPTPFGGDDEVEEVVPANAPNQRLQPGVDVERPDILEITDNGLWDGRPSLGGVWVAHPDVRDPDRVVIRNTENGRQIVGALFRRERENPGPLLQVSSDAADALGVLAGSPTRLNVVVLRRDEDAIEQAEEVAANPVTASLEAPVSVEEETLEPVQTEDSDADAAALAAPVAAAAVAAVSEGTETATEAAVPQTDTIDVSDILSDTAPAAAPALVPGADLAQLGIYSVEQNAAADAAQVEALGIAATVEPQVIGGRTVWRLVAGPLADAGQVTQLRQLGFVDAFILEPATSENEPEADSE